MKKSRLATLFYWNISILILLACVLPAVSSVPTQPRVVVSADDLALFIAETSDAARIQTASALPTITSTATSTRIPSITPSATTTFIYLLPTATLVPSYTPIIPVGNIIVNGTIVPDDRLTDIPWNCLVTGSTPPRNVDQAAGQDFTIKWTVLNTGTKDWSNNGIDFVYESGYRPSGRSIQDLPHAVLRGHSIDLKVLTTAPTNAGMYNSIWGLRVGSFVFCRMKMTFTVK